MVEVTESDRIAAKELISEWQAFTGDMTGDAEQAFATHREAAANEGYQKGFLAGLDASNYMTSEEDAYRIAKAERDRLLKPEVWPTEQLDAMVIAFDENSKKRGLRETLMAVVNAANRYALEKQHG